MIKVVKRKGKRKMWITILIIIGVIGTGLLAGVLADAPGRNEIKGLTFSDLNFNNLRNGTYVGEYKGTKSHFRDTKVEVTISEGKISDIKILKGALDSGGKPAKLTGGRSIDDLFSNVVESQSLQVDVISGATLTSNTHLKALENALKQAQSK